MVLKYAPKDIKEHTKCSQSKFNINESNGKNGVFTEKKYANKIINYVFFIWLGHI